MNIRRRSSRITLQIYQIARQMKRYTIIGGITNSTESAHLTLVRVLCITMIHKDKGLHRSPKNNSCLGDLVKGCMINS